MRGPGSTLSSLRSAPFRGRAFPLSAWWIFLFLGVQLAVAAFVLSERTVYFWDFSCFWTSAVELARTAEASFARAWEVFLHSIRFEDYNLLHAVPQALLVPLFGTSRLVYVLGVIDLYALPAAFLLFLICRRFSARIAPGEPRLPHLVVPAVLLLFPFFWGPVFKGYPGVGGLIPIFLILYLYFHRPLPELSWKRALAIGLALGWLQLFRRFYSFWIVSFGLLVLLDGAAAFLSAREGRWRILLKVLLLPALSAGTAAALVLPLAWDFILRVTATRYSDIYSAYQWSAGLDAYRNLATHWFGTMGLLVFLSSLVLLLRERKTRRIALFLGAQAFLAAALHLSIQDIFWSHVYLLLPSFLVLSSLAGVLLLSRIPSRRGRRAALAGLYLLGALATAGTFLPHLSRPLAFLSGFLPSEKVYPAKRDDLPELRRLASFLEEEARKAGPRAKIYVLAASERFNEDTLRNLGLSLGLPSTLFRRILDTHDVDKRDGFPDSLLTADLVCVAHPPQHSLAAREQAVILAPLYCFLHHLGPARAFRPLPDLFHLERGVIVAVFRRTRPCAPEETAFLSDLLKKVHPGRPFVYLPKARRKDP